MFRSRVTTASACAVLAGLGLIYITAVVLHLKDRAGLDGTGSAAWLGLVGQGGTMPPPIQHGGYFAGTRYMPLPLSLLAASGRVLNSNIAAGKIISGLSVIICLAILAYLLQKRRVALPIIVLIETLVLGSTEGTEALTGIHFDIQPVALQLAALAIIESRITVRRTALAAALCGAAMAIKITSLWGIGSLIAWVALRGRREPRLQLVITALIIFTVAGAALWLPFQIAGHGEPLANLRAVAASHEDPLWRLGTALDRYRFLVTRGNRTTAPLLLGAFVCVIVGTIGRKLGLFHIALAASIAVAFPTFADRGITGAHLIDQEILAAAVVAMGMNEMRARSLGGRAVKWVTVLLLVIAAALGIVRQWEPIVDAIRLAGSHEAAVDYGDPLNGIVKPGAIFLTEDATVSSMRGQPSVVADPFAFRRLAETHPSWDAALIHRLNDHDFAAVVLSTGAGTNPSRYDLYFFGTPIYQAVMRNYIPISTPAESGYEIYLPRS